ncbi:hypothetical protein TrCOL_g4006 [Triparma columacea]|uniref:NADP-dependent oxidoreductase domain-containing protein n=1 Tax=Triparma columacea TaxID=722753 RepID=A0A9W7GG87_9STRA|nr:hypothetical protein TrCOL_g4006 [Triparma columacea]
MPLLGLGCWKMDNAREMVSLALQNGWRHIDSACDYGNEVEVGQGIRDGLAAANLARSDVFVTSKLWNTYHSPSHVEAACRKTLTDLGLDYLDLYLIHFPIPLKFVPFDKRYPPEWVHDPDSETENVMVPDPTSPTIHETWAAMESLVEKGLVKNIGVANFNAALLLQLMQKATIKPCVNQIELHPRLQQSRLLKFCQDHGVQVTGFSPLGSASYVQIGMDRGQGTGLLSEPAVVEIAEKYGKSTAQVMLRWGVQRGTAVIPKCSSEERLKENLNVLDFVLDDEDEGKIRELDRNLRYNDPGVFCKDMGGDYPIWD